MALITALDALRVAMPLGSASKVGSLSAQPSGRVRVCSRSKKAVSAEGFLAHVSKSDCQAACSSFPRSTALRVCSSTSGGTSKVRSGSRPMTFFVAATSSTPERGPVGGPGVLLVGCRPADDRAEHDDAGLVSDTLGLLDRLVEGRDVLLVGAASGPVDGLDVPAVGLVASGDVLAEGDVGVVLDRDLVVVIDQRQVAEALHGGDRGGLGADPLLDVAVARHRVDVVVERGGVVTRVGVEKPSLLARGHGHADRVADALAQGTGGGLDTGGVAELRVPRGLAAPGAQRLQVLELEAPAAEVELDVESQARVAAGEHESVTPGPVRVGRVVAHHLLEQEVRRGRQAHGRAGVTVAHLLHGIHGQHPHGVDSSIVDLGPVEAGLRRHDWWGPLISGTRHLRA